MNVNYYLYRAEVYWEKIVGRVMVMWYAADTTYYMPHNINTNNRVEGVAIGYTYWPLIPVPSVTPSSNRRRNPFPSPLNGVCLSFSRHSVLRQTVGGLRLRCVCVWLGQFPISNNDPAMFTRDDNPSTTWLKTKNEIFVVSPFQKLL